VEGWIKVLNGLAWVEDKHFEGVKEMFVLSMTKEPRLCRVVWESGRFDSSLLLYLSKGTE